MIYLPIYQSPVVATVQPTATVASTPIAPPTKTPAPTLTPTATPDLFRQDAGDEWDECTIIGCTAVRFKGINTSNCIGPFVIDETQSTFTVGFVTQTWADFRETYGFSIQDIHRTHILGIFSLTVYITPKAAEMQLPYSSPSIYTVSGYCSPTY